MHSLEKWSLKVCTLHFISSLQFWDFCCDNERDSTCNRLVQSVSKEAGRQVLSTDMFLIVELPPLDSSQSRAHHAYSHTYTHMHTHHTQQHHTSLGVMQRREKQRKGRRRRIEKLFTSLEQKFLGKYSCILTVDTLHEHFFHCDFMNKISFSSLYLGCKTQMTRCCNYRVLHSEQLIKTMAK